MKGFLGLSWFQVIAGALAAMTSAWIASSLGVAGTIIGAAVGSLVATITAALYANTLDRSRTLIVRTDSGTVVETEAERTEVVDEPRRIHWRTVVVTTIAVLALSFGAMGAYELVTGDSYGSNTDNARIGNPFGGSPSTGNAPTERPDDEPTETTPTPTEDTPTPTEPTVTPTETTPTPTEDTPTPDTSE